jgi:hypothetical protein
MKEEKNKTAIEIYKDVPICHRVIVVGTLFLKLRDSVNLTSSERRYQFQWQYRSDEKMKWTVGVSSNELPSEY